jgi:hypothetical protein
MDQQINQNMSRSFWNWMIGLSSALSSRVDFCSPRPKNVIQCHCHVNNNSSFN